jgi:hypothetical protein
MVIRQKEIDWVTDLMYKVSPIKQIPCSLSLFSFLSFGQETVWSRDQHSIQHGVGICMCRTETTGKGNAVHFFALASPFFKLLPTCSW